MKIDERNRKQKMHTRSAFFNVREDEQTKDKFIEGYFATFDGTYELGDWGVETIAPTAFDRTLKDQPDVRALLDHESSIPLGRTTAGTLELKVDEKGLWGRITINEEDQEAMNVYARVKRGDINQCSFGFNIRDEITEQNDGKMHWTLTDVELYEVSVCTFPAYEDTHVDARSSMLENMRKKELASWKKRSLKKIGKDKE